MGLGSFGGVGEDGLVAWGGKAGEWGERGVRGWGSTSFVNLQIIFYAKRAN